jgi:hypothetical protein
MQAGEAYTLAETVALVESLLALAGEANHNVSGQG